MNISLLLRILTTPSCWLRNYDYSPTWDAQLNAALKKYNFHVSIHGYTAKLGPYTLWIANYPYACMYKCGPAGLSLSGLPSRATVFKAMDKLKLDCAREVE